METPLRILHLEDNSIDAELVHITLESMGYTPEIVVVQTKDDYLAQLDRGWDIILADYNLPQFDGLEALKLFKERRLDTSFIIISGAIDEEAAVAVMRAGASDYVTKDRLRRLGPAIERGLQETTVRRARRQEEEALVVTKALLHAAMDQSQAGIAIAGAPAGRLRYVNRAGLMIPGGSESALVNNVDAEKYVSSWNLFNLDGTPMKTDEVPLARAVLYGEACSKELIIRRPNNEERVVMANAAPVHDSAGRVTAGIVVFMDITERKWIENAQTFLLQCGLPATGEDFFESLAAYLARTLGMDYVCIDRLTGDGFIAQTVAIYNAGKFDSNVSYALKDTPCGEVVEKCVCCFPRGIRRLFPLDKTLEDLHAESYFGTTLWDSKGRRIGLIAIIGQHEMNNPEQADVLLKLVGPRAAGELERRQAEEQIQALNQQLESLVEQRTAALRTSVGALEAEIAKRHRLEREILDISEREQYRLGLDLHDGLGQELAGIALLCEVLAGQLEEATHPLARPAANITTYIRTAIQSTRRIAKGLYPIELERYGLLLALEELAVRTCERAGIRCELQQRGAAPLLDKPTSIHIYRIVQECISNALKHARPQQVLIESVAGAGVHTFTVTDDGTGFAKPESGTGMGLHLMRYRARVIGAQIDIEQPACGGCRVSCRLTV